MLFQKESSARDEAANKRDPEMKVAFEVYADSISLRGETLVVFSTTFPES